MTVKICPLDLAIDFLWTALDALRDGQKHERCAGCYEWVTWPKHTKMGVFATVDNESDYCRVYYVCPGCLARLLNNDTTIEDQILAYAEVDRAQILYGR